MINDQIVQSLGDVFSSFGLKGEIDVLRSKDSRFGDFFTNFLLKNPLEESKISDLVEKLESIEMFDRVEFAKPGFLNFWLNSQYLSKFFAKLSLDGNFGKVDDGRGKSAVIEIVSANPTGPIHLGNARGGPIGDVIANLFEFFGYKVTREFYLNNIGGQVKKFLASIESLHAGNSDGEYSGEFYESLAKDVQGDSQKAFEKVIDGIKKDLEDLGVKYDNWVLESQIAETKTARIVDFYKEKGLTKEKDGALWFAPSDEFLQDRECVLLRSDEGNTPTYFANDIAYHKDKYDRGYEHIINIWGANHHGHVPRMKASLKALGLNENKLEVILYQWVSLIENGQKKSMSKRKGEFVTLRDVLGAVGRDPIRFAFLSRDYNTPLDIDLDTLVKKDKENQLYYIEYALVRINSILAKADEGNRKRDFVALGGGREKELMLAVFDYPRILWESYKERKVQKIAFYLLDLADLWHKYYEETGILNEKNEGVRDSRIYLAKCIGEVIKLGLSVLGVKPPERM